MGLRGDKVKIAHYREMLLPKYMGGAEVSVHELANHQAKMRQGIFVLTTTPGNVKNTNYNRILLVEEGSKKWALALPVKLSKWIIKNDIDILHVQGYARPFILKMLGTPTHWNRDILDKPKIVFTLRGLIPKESESMIHKQMKKADYVTFLDYHMLELGGKLKLNNYEYIPNPVDVKRFQIKRDEATRKRLLGDCSTLITTVSRLNPERTVEIFIEAASKFIDESNIRFIIAGDGPERHVLENASKSSEANVTFLGQIPNDRIPELLAASDIFVNSAFPGIGRNVLEAMATGLPVLRRSFPQDDPQLVEGKHFIDYQDSDNLAEIIKDLNNNPKRYIHIGKSAQKLVQEKFGYDEICNKYDKIYEDILNK